MPTFDHGSSQRSAIALKSIPRPRVYTVPVRQSRLVMLPSRVVEHIKTHNWLAATVDFLIVVGGVFVGLQVSNWNADRERTERTGKIVQAIRRDLGDAIDVETAFGRNVDAAFLAFDAARNRGEYPPPVFLRIPGSDTPPKNIWEAVLQSQLSDLIEPSLLFELGFYYDEREGLGAKFLRYAEFTENEILPRLKEDPRVFYTTDGSRLAPMFEAHVDRLRERQKEFEVLNTWARCLDKQLSSPQQPGKSCRPELTLYGIEMPGALSHGDASE